MPCQSLKVLAGLAEPVPKHSHVTDHKFASDQVVERDSTSHQVAARICWIQGKRVLAGQRLDRLGLYEGKVRIRLVASRERARRVEDTRQYAYRHCPSPKSSGIEGHVPVLSVQRSE